MVDMRLRGLALINSVVMVGTIVGVRLVFLDDHIWPVAAWVGLAVVAGVLTATGYYYVGVGERTIRQSGGGPLVKSAR
jgi:hypothetical protein